MNRREALQNVALLLGGTLSASTVAGVLGGCAPGKEGTWRPKAVTPEQNELITAIAELILPETDTPGAAGAQVNRFIDLMLADWYTKEERARFLTDLAAVEQQSQEKHGNSFLACTPTERHDLLAQLEKAALAEAGDRLHIMTSKDIKPFFLQMKELTLVGYYTSKVGATRELQYKAVPGEYRGCVPLDELGGRA